MKNQVEFVLLSFFGLTILVFLFSFDITHAAKIQSGVTIKQLSPAETEKICDDGKDNDNDGKIDVADEDCATASASPVSGTCGLQIVSGVPINYGQLTAGQTSAEKQVMIKNEGTSTTPAKLMIKGGNWIGDSAPNPTISGPEVTRVAIAPVDFNNKKSLSLAGWELGQIAGGQSIPVYFQFLTWVNAPSGSFHQDVTIDLLC